jgi:ComF family protein
MKNILSDFLSLLYPDLCIICNENLLKSEQNICIKCLNEIPVTNYHLTKNNPVDKRFWGKTDIESATSFYFFTKGSPFQKLIHELKYRNNKEIGVYFGKYAASNIATSTFFEGIDLIVPIPLHPAKYKKRGYNQSELLCKGIADYTGYITDFTNLKRIKETETQTKKSVYDRYINTSGIFEVQNPEIFENKHILLVDDVLTTGSTLEAAAQELLKCTGTKVSIFTLAIA